ncbi:MAG: spermidine synthase [Desulfuromonadales bacterium]|nr:MAG: spermidine synthase [Desulfuromonadales bacterium]
MAIPWTIIESISTKDGVLELRQRGERDFLITVGGFVLMNSSAHRSEVALGNLACGHLKNHAGPRVLVGGLGMGYTLRAVIDVLPATGRVVVAELNAVIPQWCRGPLAGLTACAVNDPRVTVEIADVAALIRRYAGDGGLDGFDAVVLDLYQGPNYHSHKRDDPLYGSKAIGFTRAILKPGGVFAVWGENYDAGFDKRLREAGFEVTSERPGRGGLRHVVYVASLRAPRNRGRSPS